MVPLWPAGCDHVWVEWVWLPLLALPQNGLGSWVISVRFGFMIVFYDCALHRGALCPNCPFWALPQVRLRVGLLGRFPRFLGLSPAPVGLVLSLSVFLRSRFSVLRPCDEATVGYCPVLLRPSGHAPNKQTCGRYPPLPGFPFPQNSTCPNKPLHLAGVLSAGIKNELC